VDDFHEWWDELHTEMTAEHDEVCEAGEDGKPCRFADKQEHIAASYIMPHLKQMVRESGIYKKEAS
jgi:hypothetical protein